MPTRRVMLATLAGLPILGYAAVTGREGTAAQDDSQGTISALETRVTVDETSMAVRAAAIDLKNTEIAELQTQVPLLTATEIAMETIYDGDDWTLRYGSAYVSTTAGWGTNALTPNGIFLVFLIEVTLRADKPSWFPFDVLSLSTVNNSGIGPDSQATYYLSIDRYGTDLGDKFTTGIARLAGVVFDVDPALGSVAFMITNGYEIDRVDVSNLIQDGVFS